MKFLRIIAATIALTIALATPMSALAGGWQFVVFLDGQWYNIGVPTSQEKCAEAQAAAQARGIPAVCEFVG